MKFHVPEMSCGHCTAAILKQISALDAAADVATDLDAKTVTVATTRDIGAVAAAIRAAGFEATAA